MGPHAVAGATLAVMPAAVPRVIGWWLSRPVSDDDLGLNILHEMVGAGTALLGHFLVAILCGDLPVGFVMV